MLTSAPLKQHQCLIARTRDNRDAKRLASLQRSNDRRPLWAIAEAMTGLMLACAIPEETPCAGRHDFLRSGALGQPFGVESSSRYAGWATDAP